MEKLLLLIVTLALLIFTAQRTSGAEIGPWQRFPIHDITGTAFFANPQTVFVNNFGYDGSGFAVYLYVYLNGQSVDGESGYIVPLIGSSDGTIARRRYIDETIVGNLARASRTPGGAEVALSACDVTTLTVWCEPFSATFSRVAIPTDILTGDSQSCALVEGNVPVPVSTCPGVDLPFAPFARFDNCESFADDTVQVSWTVDNTNTSSEVDFRICSCLPPTGEDQYMAFGLSGRRDMTFMVGADATVAWVNTQTGQANAVDYYLTGRDQCRTGEGACPDTLVTRNNVQCEDNIRADSIEGGVNQCSQQCVLFSRPFTTDDGECDINFDPNNEDQYIVWANGPLGFDPNSDQRLAFRHFSESSLNSDPVHLGRTPSNNCQRPITCSNCPPFEGLTRTILEDTTLSVRIGPSASTRGYGAITGNPAWGIAYWIDEELIPELVVARNKTYTFIIEGGNDPAADARYHPFYITSSASGGRIDNTDNSGEIVYAGFDEEDNPTAVGRYCEFSESVAATEARESCQSFGDYMDAVRDRGVNCEAGEAGVLVWTPDQNTPDEVFYQCASHLNLGWRIRVTDGAQVTDSARVTEVTDSTRVTTDSARVTDGALPTHSLLSLPSLLLLVTATLRWNI